MTQHLHELTEAELSAACKALTREQNLLQALESHVEGVEQLHDEQDRLSTVHGVLLMALRNRRKEDRERAYLAKGGE